MRAFTISIESKNDKVGSSDYDRIIPLSYFEISKERELTGWLRRWSNKPDVVGSIPVTTEFY